MSLEEYGEAQLPVKRRVTMEERAEKPELKLLARINMAIVTPALLIGITGMGAFIWKGMEDDRRDAKDNNRALERSLNNTAAQIGDLRSTLDAIVRYQIPGTVQLFDSRFNAQANRIDEISRVNERQDRDIQDLRNFKFGGSK